MHMYGHAYGMCMVHAMHLPTPVLLLLLTHTLLLPTNTHCLLVYPFTPHTPSTTYLCDTVCKLLVIECNTLGFV